MPRLCLSMIVRDAEATLARCLESARPSVDEIVVADTGSADRTREIAADHGARVFSIPWENDFARARNRALEAVGADWVLALDADEMLDSESARSIPKLLARSQVAAYQVAIRNYVLTLNHRVWDRTAKRNTSELSAARAYPAYVEHENVRLFRRLPEIYFEGRVHETVGSRVLAAGLRLDLADFIIHHFGLSVDPATRARKNDLYRELGRLKIRENPKDAQAHFELGIEEFENLGDATAALGLFERAAELNPRLHVAWLFSGLALLRLGRCGEAVPKLRRAEELGAKKFLVAEAEGDAHFNLGAFETARRCYRRALERGGKSAALESKLGLAEVRVGQTVGGLARLRRAISIDHELEETYDRLITACIWMGRLEEAAETAESKLAAVPPQPAYFLRAASIRAQLNDVDRTARLLRLGLVRFPEAPKLLEALHELEAKTVNMN